MRDDIKQEIHNILVQYVSGKDVDKVVDKIAEIIDKDFAKAIAEGTNIKEILDAVDMEIVSKNMEEFKL